MPSPTVVIYLILQKSIKFKCPICGEEVRLLIDPTKYRNVKKYPIVLRTAHGKNMHIIKILLNEKLEIEEVSGDYSSHVEKSFKTIVIGDTMVGKTSLIRRYVERKFDKTYIITMGVDITNKRVKIGDRNVNLILWDIGGQEKFDAIRKIYFRGANGALIVYDVTNYRSFVNVRKWFEELMKYTRDIPFILVGNKIDLKDERVVKSEEGAQLSEQLGCPFYETSAKTGENVDKIFYELAKLMLSFSEQF